MSARSSRDGFGNIKAAPVGRVPVETRLDRRIDKLDAKIDRIDVKLTKFEENEIDKRLELEVRVTNIEKQLGLPTATRS